MAAQWLLYGLVTMVAVNVVAGYAYGGYGCRNGDFYADDDDCRVFYRCAHGKRVRFECPLGKRNSIQFNSIDFTIICVLVHVFLRGLLITDRSKDSILKPMP
jgi:hypothetical protein